MHEEADAGLARHLAPGGPKAAELLERLGKALLLSAEGETSEIIRRRLFDWTTMPPEARRTAAEHGEWVRNNRKLVPTGGTSGGVEAGASEKGGEPERPKTAPPPKLTHLGWSGEVPPQKWMNFYTKVLSRFATRPGLKLTLRVDVAPAEGITPQAVEEMKLALRELGLDDSLNE